METYDFRSKFAGFVVVVLLSLIRTWFVIIDAGCQLIVIQGGLMR